MSKKPKKPKKPAPAYSKVDGAIAAGKKAAKPKKKPKLPGTMSPSTTKRLVALVEMFDENRLKFDAAKAKRKEHAAMVSKREEEIFELGRLARDKPEKAQELPKLEREREQWATKLTHAEAEVSALKENLTQGREQVFQVIRDVAAGESLFDGKKQNPLPNDGTPPPKSASSDDGGKAASTPSSGKPGASKPETKDDPLDDPGEEVPKDLAKGQTWRILKSSRQFFDVTVEKIVASDGVAVIIDRIHDQNPDKWKVGDKPIISAPQWQWMELEEAPGLGSDDAGFTPLQGKSYRLQSGKHLSLIVRVNKNLTPLITEVTCYKIERDADNQWAEGEITKVNWQDFGWTPHTTPKP